MYKNLLYPKAMSKIIISAKPKITPIVALTLPCEKLSGISSEHTTASMAPAENESAHGRMPRTACTASAPITPATISTAPES